MNVRNVMPDKQKAKTLFETAKSFIKSIEPIKKTADPSFLINIEYDILHSICTAILAFDGEKLIGKDHHRLLIERISERYNLNPAEKHLFDEFRKIRNDINYYGQRSKDVIDDFYNRNKVNINQIQVKLMKIIEDKMKLPTASSGVSK